MRIGLEEAARRLKGGQVVAIPTETVYGLAACYDNPSAVRTLFELKGRPPANPLILHVADFERVLPFLTEVPDKFRELAEAFWPGPLTLVLPVKEESISSVVRAGLKTQAFRVPNHPLTSALLEMTGPLVAPSANLSGRPSAVDPSHVEEDFGKELPVLEGGRSEKGVESTILIYREGKWHAGRLGALALESFAPILGYIPALSKGQGQPLCPGQLFRHYAPSAKLSFHLDMQGAPAIIGLKGKLYPEDTPLFLLGESKNPEEAAHALYSLLRKLDEQKIEEAWIDSDLPSGGLWDTISERLRKASNS